MKNELYKISFTKFYSEKYKDSIDLNEKNTVFIERFNCDNRNPMFILENKYEDEQSFVENFANPLFHVSKNYCMVVIEETGDKISLKYFYGGKFRRVSKSWFKVYKNVEFLTVNRKTGDFYCGYLHDYQKKKKFTKSIRRNYFASNPASSIFSKIKNGLNDFCENSSEIVYEISKKFFEILSQDSIHLDSDQKLMKFYLDKKGFKYPNNFWVYVRHMWGKDYRKKLKKNDSKLVDTFMDIWGVRGKKLKKYLHTVQSLNIELYLQARKVFGDDWLNQDGDVISEILNSKATNINFTENFKSFLTHEENRKVYSTFKMVLKDHINVWTFNDHINYYTRLKEYGETELKWSSDGVDFDKFQQEHLDWSDKLDHYRKGFYTRTYPEYFYEKIENEIDGYFPVLLKDSNEYNNESSIQSNCVKGYIGKASSIIISLRKNEIESTERATIEYRVIFLKNLDKIKADRVQTLGRYNQSLNQSWNDVLLKLDRVVLSCFQDEKFETVKIEKICKNGVKLTSGSHFNEEGNLTWTERKTSDNNYYYDWEW